MILLLVISKCFRDESLEGKNSSDKNSLCNKKIIQNLELVEYDIKVTAISVIILHT